MRRSQLIVALLLSATFAAGVAGGVAADRLWFRPADSAGSGEARDGRGGNREDRDEGDDEEDTVIERFSEELGLSARQEARIDTILEHYRESMERLRDEVRPRYDALVDSARTRIEGVLDSTQARRYRQLLERKGRRDDGQGDDGGGKDR